MGRVSPHLANRFSGVKKQKSGKWQISFYDKSGTRKYRTVVAKTAAQARKAGEKLVDDLKDVELTPRKNIFTPGELNSVIDEALEDGRIPPERVEELKSLDPVERKRQIRTFSREVDGKLVYKPLVPTSWGDLQFKMNKKDKIRIQARVRKKINAAKKVGKEAHQELLGEMDYIKEAKNRSDLVKWENRFNNKYAELVGDWKTVASGHLNKSSERWAKENIKNHARREFIRSGFNKSEAVKKAQDYVRGLSDKELVRWNEKLVPIKEYNDRVYKLALANNDPDILNKLLAVHHVQPVGKEGTVKDPANIRGVRGGQYKKVAGSEHAKIHDPIFDSWYENLKNQNVTIGKIAPPGAGVPTRVLGPSGELMPEGEWVSGLDESVSPERRAISEIMDIRKFKQLSKIDFTDLLKNNPKKAMMIAALFPFMFGYSASGVAQDEVPPEFLDVSKQDRVFANPEIDKIWQAAKYHTYKKEGSALEWANLFDFTDLSLFGRGPRKFNMASADDGTPTTIPERKMVDPTWRGTGLQEETIGDKITILDRLPEFWNRKRESIWT